MSEIRHAAITLRLKAPLHTARAKITSRRGFLVGLEYDGKKLVSEIALLPEFGTEHFEHAERILDGDSLMLASAPATMYGLDCLRYAAERVRNAQDAPVSLPVAILLPGGTFDEVLQAAQSFWERGFRTLKQKVAHRPLAEDIQVVNVLTRELPDTKFRLDANFGWTEEQTLEFARAVPLDAIEWLEDPCHMPLSNWKILSARSGLPLACDEALDERALSDYSGALGVVAAIVKPARLGAIGGREQLFRRLREENVNIIFSSMYDSSIGLTVLAHFAAEFGSKYVAHGLGTLDLLEEDTVVNSVLCKDGSLHVPPLAELAERLLPQYASPLRW